MNIIAIDQARNGAWSVFNYDTKELVAYDTFSFDTSECTFAKAIVNICDVVVEEIDKYDVSAVFAEDIQMRKNVAIFKRLAQLQGGLISTFERREYLYDFVAPSKWQSFCRARGRTSKEIKEKLLEAKENGAKQSKVLSIQYVKEKFGVNTQNDNLADAISIGDFVVNNITIVEK